MCRESTGQLPPVPSNYPMMTNQYTWGIQIPPLHPRMSRESREISLHTLKHNTMFPPTLGNSRIYFKNHTTRRLQRSSFQDSKEQPSTQTIKGDQRKTISTIFLYRESRGLCSSRGRCLLPANRKLISL